MNGTEEIWHEFHEKLLAFISKRINDKSYAEDLLHDVFLKIHKNIDSLQNLKKVESWIYQITRNTIIDYYRGYKIHEDLPQWLSTPEPDDETIFKQELSDCLISLIDELPQKYGQALKKSDVERRSQKEIAHKENISVPGAKSRIQRGRTMLKEVFHDCCKIELGQDIRILGCHSKKQCC